MDELIAFLHSWRTEVLEPCLSHVKEGQEREVAAYFDRVFAGWTTNLVQEMSFVNSHLAKGVLPPKYHETGLRETSTKHLTVPGLEWRAKGEKARRVLFLAVHAQEQPMLLQARDAMNQALVAHGNLSLLLSEERWKFLWR